MIATSPTFSVEWAMPSRWTFQIPPVADFLARHIPHGAVIVDPFCGASALAQHRNDLARGGVDAAAFVDGLIARGIVADVVLFDPPYSPRQISECYKSIGRKAAMVDTQNAALYGGVRSRLSRLLLPGGLALSFGWQSSGFGKWYDTIEIMLVQHGGAHNDTICVAQRKPAGDGPLFPAPPTVARPVAVAGGG